MRFNMTATALFYQKPTQEPDNKTIFPPANKTDEENQKYTYWDFKEHANIICHTCFRTTYIACGILQFFAIWVGLTRISHHDNMLIMIASFILGFLPFIGALFGIISAHINWSWSFHYCLFVFIIPYFIANAPLFMIALYDFHKDQQHWKSYKKRLQL